MPASPQQIPLTSSCNAPFWMANTTVDFVTLINLDQTNTVYIGTTSSIQIGGPNTIPLGPNASVTYPANKSLYGVAPNNTHPILVTPGAISYSPSGLAIVGNVIATVSGSVSISGTPNVNIANTPSVTISGTPSVIISGTPTVNLASGTTVSITGTTTVSISGTPTVALAAGTTVSISGTATVNVTGNVNVIGQGGFVAPGQLAVLLNGNSAAATATPGGSVSRGPFTVSTYNSVVLTVSLASTNSSGATGAAICALLNFQWQDNSGNTIEQDLISVLIGCTFTVQVPCKGSTLFVNIVNPGTVGSITFPINSLFLIGDYRTVPDITFLSYGFNAPTITGFTVEASAFPVTTVASWLANLVTSAETASTSYIAFLAPWKGPVSGWYQQITQALSNNGTIVDMSYATQGNVTVGAPNTNGTLVNLPSAVQTAPVPINFFAPPTQLAFIYKSVATAGGETILMLTGESNA